MILAHIIERCEDKLICDLAEVYHVLNYRELSPDMVAALCIGLRDDSRVKMELSGNKITVDQIMKAMIVDSLQFLAWTKTKDAQKGQKYKAKSMVKALNGEYDHEHDDLATFDSIEAYEAYMKRFK